MSARRRSFRPLRAALLVLGCACSARQISLGAGKPDAAQSDTAQPDAAQADAAQDGESAFSKPEIVPGISTDDSRDDDPSLTEDLTLLYFDSRRDGGSGKEDIWYAAREDVAAPFREPAPATNLNTEYRETGIALTADGLTLYFSSDRPGGAGGLDIYVARRARREDEFGEPERVAHLSSEQDDLISAVDVTSRVAYLARRPLDGAYALYRAERGVRDADWSEPVALDSVNSEDAESDAYPFEDGRRLVFSRKGDLFLAARADEASDFELVGAWSSLNSESNEQDAWVSSDGNYVMFASNRDGSYRLYQAHR
jgi:hypothetical protein